MAYGSIWGMDGNLSFIRSPETPCLRCMFQEPPPHEVFPVLGTTPAVIGSLQVLEAVKYLTGISTNLTGRLLVWDGSTTGFRTFSVHRDPDCPSCSGKQGTREP